MTDAAQPRPGPAARFAAAVDGVLWRPEADAAGRSGLFRVFFALFYLWHAATYPAAMLAGVPEGVRRQMLLLGVPRRLGVPYVDPTLIEAVLVGGLIALLLGWRTRLATAVVLAAGLLVEAQFSALDDQRGRVILVFYVPLFMLLAGDWGATHSLDALRRRRQGRPTVSPHDSSPRFAVPARALLFALSFLFCFAAVGKIAFGGTWLSEDRLMAAVALQKNVRAGLFDLPMTQAVPWFAGQPWLYGPSRFVVLALELLFPLALLGGASRRLFVFSALAFHAANAIFLLVTFTPVLAIYPAFLNLQRGLDAVTRFVPGRLRSLRPPARPAWHVGLFAAAAIVGFTLLWRFTGVPQSILTLGGRLDWRTIWFPVLPLAAIGAAVAAVQLASSLFRRPSSSTPAHQSA